MKLSWRKSLPTDLPNNTQVLIFEEEAGYSVAQKFWNNSWVYYERGCTTEQLNEKGDLFMVLPEEPFKDDEIAEYCKLLIAEE